MATNSSGNKLSQEETEFLKEKMAEGQGGKAPARRPRRKPAAEAGQKAKQPKKAERPEKAEGAQAKAKNGGASRPAPKAEGKAEKKAPAAKAENKAPAKTAGAKVEHAVEKEGAEKNGANRRGGNRRGGRGKGGKAVSKTPLKIIPIGGLNEIGKNMTAYEYQNDIFIVDCGLAFPDNDMLGVDLVIPDFTYLERNKEKIRGLVITHGHEDHIGSIPYFLRKCNVPVYGTGLTIGLIEGKLREHGLLSSAKLNVVKPGDTVKLGCMTVEFIRVNHSIPDAVALAIYTPVGIVVQTGDFKVDYTPIGCEVIDLARFGELGTKGVLALLSDSTNAIKPGKSMSEKKVGESFEKLFEQAKNKRMIVATFASNIYRVQQIVDAAVRSKRKVALSGRSMINVVTKALELGYLKIPDGVLVEIEAISRYPAEKTIIITTGTQGEPMAALSRMAVGMHRNVEVNPNDFIIISATPIPGNEKMVSRVVDELLKLGAEVIYERMYEIHASGHAQEDELRLMLSLVKPKFFMPVHGEYHHLKRHAEIAMDMGIPQKNIVVGDIGRVVELNETSMKITGTVPAGKVLVDGLGVGDVGSIVLRDRKHLAEDGLIIAVCTISTETGEVVAGPDIVSRGFVYVRESEELIFASKKIVRRALEDCKQKGVHDWSMIKTAIKDALANYVYQQTKRKPMILPVIMEV